MCKLIKQKKMIIPYPLEKLKKELKKNSKKTYQKGKLLPNEMKLVQRMKDWTRKLNKNNVTRTQAYLDFYNRHPEIHWAFLGHMVSRNGGWNMTDLKGAFLSRLLSRRECSSFFSFLERGNWLIFQDVFPQFLIYEESLKCGQNLFHLLQHLHISIFMEILWNQFWEDHNSHLLTLALIINEQSYLESRVLTNPAFKKDVFNTFQFKLQDFLSMNHILFPYFINEKIKLVGQTLHHFESLHERIQLGKRLYTILFGDQNRLQLTVKWANEHPHSGSRKDYWPHLFNDVDEDMPRKILKPRLNSCQLVSGSPRIYSPKLKYAWKDKNHLDPETTDWYKNWQVIEYFIDSHEIIIDGEIENEYCKTLERLELAAIAKKTFIRFEE